MKSSQKAIAVGFVDLLAGFMIASTAMLIIIRYGGTPMSDVGASPKDYLLYTIEVDASDYAGTLSAEESLLQFFIKTPTGSWLSSNVGNEGNIINTESGLFSFDGDEEFESQFIGIGPSKADNSGMVYYHVYGSAMVNGETDWGVGARYYSNTKLEFDSLTENNWDKLVNSSLQIRHKIEHLDRKSQLSPRKPLPLGESVYLSTRIQ